jgi:hypothetical protein
MHYVMDGFRFIMLNETPCAEPHAGCCGDWGLETPGYPIRPYLAHNDRSVARKP